MFSIIGKKLSTNVLSRSLSGLGMRAPVAQRTIRHGDNARYFSDVRSDGDLMSSHPVLRRVWRRMDRFSSSILSGETKVPNHLGTISVASFFTAIGIYGMIIGGHTSNVMHNVTSTAGLGINEIVVSGNIRSSDIDVIQQLDLDGTTSLVALDLDKAHDQLLALPWVVQAQLRKVYPNSLHLNLTEREAFAIWQHGSQLALLDQNGDVIAPFEGVYNGPLPLYVGLGADKHFHEMEKILAQWPEFKAQTKAIIRVADRRWDLRLANGITLNLPEFGIENALAHFSAFNAQEQVLMRDIAEVDLRLMDRVTIRLTSDALERRKIAVAKRAKQLKAEERI